MARPHPLAEIRRFFRTPKGLLIIVLAILAALAAPGEGIALVAPGLAIAVGVAALRRRADPSVQSGAPGSFPAARSSRA